MTAQNYAACLAITLDYEGGNDDDPNDPGGRTSRGITQSEYNRYRQGYSNLPADVWKAPQSAIEDIYRRSYWDTVNGDAWANGMDLTVFDAGVNSGTGRALAWARRAVGSTANFGAMAATIKPDDVVPLIKKYNGIRLSFLQALANWRYFGRGWGRRVVGIEALSVKMALKAANYAPVAVEAKLRGDASEAKKKGNGAVTGGGVAIGSGAGGAISSWDVDWITVALTCGLIAVGILLIRYAIIQHQRAAAYNSAASEGAPTS